MYRQGEKVTVKSTGKVIDIKGMAVAELDDQMRVTMLDIYFDPMDMFRQMDEGNASEDEHAAAQAACPFLGQGQGGKPEGHP